MHDISKPKPEILVTLDGGSLAAWMAVVLLKSPKFRVLTRVCAHLKRQNHQPAIKREDA
jgi:hypothetical protein